MGVYNYRHHCVSVRYRITGFGTLHNGLASLDDVALYDLPDVTLSATTDRPKNQLANFISSRMSLTFYVDAISENFVIGQITFYTKPVATGFPQ